MLALAGTALTSAAENPQKQLANSTRKQVIEGELGQRLDEQLARLAVQGFAGVVLVARGQDIVLSKGYGLMDRGRNRRYSPNTVFDMGSITKSFTAAAILKLESEGRLKVSDRLHRFFPDAPQDKRDITLHQLLTHTAGFAHAIGDDYTDQASRDEWVSRALRSELIHSPGERYDYSNVGYTLLGVAVEQVTHQPYERYLRDAFLIPSGMRETGYVLANWDRQRLNHTYLDGRDRGTALDQAWAHDGPYWNLRANGGLITTITDLHRWYLALRGTSVLSDQTLQKYMAPRVPKSGKADSYYGYGWVVQQTPQGQRLVHHDGGDDVFLARFNMYPDEDVLVTWTTNDIRATEAALAALGKPRLDRWLEQLIFEKH